MKLTNWIPRYTWCKSCRAADRKTLAAHLHGCPEALRESTEPENTVSADVTRYQEVSE